MYPAEKHNPAELLLLPPPAAVQPARQTSAGRKIFKLALVVFATILYLSPWRLWRIASSQHSLSPDSFFWSRNDASSLCPGVRGNKSYAGYIALKGETADKPRRSFYWCAFGSVFILCSTNYDLRLFEAQNGDDNAPVMFVASVYPICAGLPNCSD
jgi:hypothetical protein